MRTATTTIGTGERWDDDYDEDEYDDDDAQYEVQELIDSEVTLTHGTGPDGTRLEETSLSVDDDEVCASTETGNLEPYSEEYEGYMGNWGNTLDRWYHRAAVVVWPRERTFANRAETSPVWALDGLAAMASAGDVAGSRSAAATLAPFWDSAVRVRPPEETGRTPGLFGKALRVADAVADAKAATMLLRPFRIENLTDAYVNSFGGIADRYGQQWTAELLRTPPRSGQPAPGTRLADMSAAGGRGDRAGDVRAAGRRGAAPGRQPRRRRLRRAGRRLRGAAPHPARPAAARAR